MNCGSFPKEKPDRTYSVYNKIRKAESHIGYEKTDVVFVFLTNAKKIC